jgi:hypothetical protein
MTLVTLSKHQVGLGRPRTFFMEKELMMSILVDETISVFEWFVFTKGLPRMADEPYDNPNSQLSQPSRLEIRRDAFTKLPQWKRDVLKELKTFTILQGRSPDAFGTSIYWFFPPEIFLDVVKKHPWLLDSNLGEPV